AVFTADRRQALAQLSDVQDAGGADGVTLFRLTLESPELPADPGPYGIFVCYFPDTVCVCCWIKWCFCSLSRSRPFRSTLPLFGDVKGRERQAPKKLPVTVPQLRLPAHQRNFFAVDEDVFHICLHVQRIAVRHHHVRQFAGVKRAQPISYAPHLSGINGERL